MDGIRGIAVSLVVLFHYFGGNDQQSIIANKAIRWFFNRGWSGVDLFFILSGFLIGGILLDNKIDGRFAGVFYYRRFLRIFPLYYALLVIAAITVAALPGIWWVYPIYLQNIPAAFGHGVPEILGVTWSLAVEEHFYVILPALIAITTRSQLAWSILGFVVLAIILRCGVFIVGSDHAESFSYYFTFCRLDELMLGVGAALLVRQKNYTPNFAVLYSALAISGLAIVATSALAPRYPWVINTIGLWVYCSFYLSLLLLAVSGVGPASSITNNATLRWLGQRAYSLYLFHQALLLAALSFLPALNANAQRAFSMAVLIAIAWFLWKFVEEPLIAIGHRAKYEGK